MLGHIPTPSRNKRGGKRYTPNFVINKESLEPSKISKKKWKETVFTFECDLTPADASYFAQGDLGPKDIDEHLSFMAADAKRNAEVSLKWLSKADRQKFEQAQTKEIDQWVENGVFSIARKAGIPVDRIMTMRWILTWKDAPSNSVAKARLVIKGFTDPDLTTIRAEAPTLSKLGRHMLLQMGASHGFTFEMGDVKTAFLQGDRGEAERDVYARLVPELSKYLGLSWDQIIPVSYTHLTLPTKA